MASNRYEIAPCAAKWASLAVQEPDRGQRRSPARSLRRPAPRDESQRPTQSWGSIDR